MKCLLSVSLAVTALVSGTQASTLLTNVTLANGNSEARLALTTADGMYSWTVDGSDNQLFSQWFWYRVGATGPEAPISDLILTATEQPNPGQLTSTYVDPGFLFELTVTYDLNGGAPGSGSALINETITINSTFGDPLEFHFFQYTDFDLGTGPDLETATIENNNYALVIESPFSYAETIQSPPATRAEAAIYDSTFQKLTDADADDLNNVLTAGVGDVTFAFQWDLELAAAGSLGSSATIIKNKRLTVPPIPEPTTAALLGAGTLLLLGRGRRGRRS